MNPGGHPVAMFCSTVINDRLSGATSSFVVILVVVLATVSFRFVHLDADPVSWFTQETGYHIDEGYKTLSPRNLALFGTTHWHPEDEYSGWMVSSAVTQWPYYWSFKAFGVTLGSARAVSVGFFTILLGATALFLWRRRSPMAAALGVLLLSVDPGLFFFSRSALFETALTLFTFLPLFLLVWTAETLSRRLWVLVASGLLLAFVVPAFFFLKASIVLYIAPVAAASILWAARRRTGASAPLVLLGVVLTGAAIGWFVTFEPRLVDKIDLDIVARVPQTLLLNPTHTLSPVAFLLAQIVLLELIARDPRVVFDDLFRLSLAALVILTPIAFAAFGSNPARYHVPILPAAVLLVVERLTMDDRVLNPLDPPGWRSPYLLALALVFASAAMTLWASIEYYLLRNLPLPLGEDPGLSEVMVLKTYPLFLLILMGAVAGVATYYRRREVRSETPDVRSADIPWVSWRRSVVVLTALHLVIGGSMDAAATLNPSFRSREIADRVTRLAGMEATVAGDWAPFFAVDTRLRVLYTRPDWNSPDDFPLLRPRYFLDSRSYYDQQVLAGLEAMNGVTVGEPIFLGTYHGQPISLRMLTYARGGVASGPH